MPGEQVIDIDKPLVLSPELPQSQEYTDHKQVMDDPYDSNLDTLCAPMLAALSPDAKASEPIDEYCSQQEDPESTEYKETQSDGKSDTDQIELLLQDISQMTLKTRNITDRITWYYHISVWTHIGIMTIIVPKSDADFEVYFLTHLIWYSFFVYYELL